VTDATVYQSHRFDCFMVRSADSAQTADYFIGQEFQLEMYSPVEPATNGIPLGIHASGDKVIIDWSNPVFYLQSAPSVLGGFTTITNAHAPYTNAITDSQKLYRLKAN
jgi:hypothetical protein